jgi:diacylglycerol O-acyltransferase / wax synthase
MPQRLSALDSVFLNFESEREPMHIGAVYIFEGKPEIRGRPGVPGLVQTVEDRLYLVPRYRQRIQNVPAALGHPVWVDDPDFDLGYHLRRLALPKPGGNKELLDVVARLHSRILDRARPLWEMYIIEGLKGGRVAIYAKTHHAMVDGIAAVDLATTIFDFDPEGWRAPAGEPFRPRPLLSSRELVEDVVKEAAGALRGMAGSLLRRPTSAPLELAGQALKTVHARELLHMLRPVPGGPLNVKVGRARRVELVPISLPRVKAIKNALGGTVNDVALAVVGEAINAFLDHRGEEIPEDLMYRVLVPVSVRNEDEKPALGNRVSAMFLDMPVGRMPARRRLQMIQRSMGALKDKRQSVASRQLMELASRAPALVHSLAGRGAYANQRLVNMVISNVPGVQVPAYAGGARLLEAYPLLPVAANLGVVVCVASYNGGLYFGVVADYGGFPDLDVLARGIEAGVENLERAAGVRPPKPTARTARRRAQPARPSSNGVHRSPTRQVGPTKVLRASVREAARLAATTAPPKARRGVKAPTPGSAPPLRAAAQRR